MHESSHVDSSHGYQVRPLICRGELLAGGSWGCDRKFNGSEFANHFRIDVGKKCCKPLLDEEAAQRQQGIEFSADEADADGLPAGLLSRFPFLRG